MRFLLGLVGAAGILCGCANVAAYTKIEADGSFTRMVRYSGNALGGGEVGNIEKLFALPSTHPGVSYKLTSSEGDKVMTTSRRVSAGHPVPPDIFVCGEDGKPNIRCSVVVQKRSDGDVAYDETVHWMGTPGQAETDSMTKQIRAFWNRVLPERCRNKLSDDKTATTLERLFSQTMFGPPYPYAIEAAASPDLIDMELGDTLAQPLTDSVKGIFPDMTDQEVKEFQDNLGKPGAFGSPKPANDERLKLNSKPGASGTQEETFLFVVRPPGAVVETNGLTTHDGHVYWSLFKESLQYGDAVLHLVAHTGGAK